MNTWPRDRYTGPGGGLYIGPGGGLYKGLGGGMYTGPGGGLYTGSSEIYQVHNLEININDGEGETKTMNLGDVTALSKRAIHFPEATILWRSFTLQEAIDFAVYAIRTTIATLRFQSQPVTVGEPIDLLVIKPNQAMWLSKKELHMS